jgi:hypothetical protein
MSPKTPSASADTAAFVPALPQDATVKVVGLGGVGGILARYLAIFLASLPRSGGLRLILMDGDTFEAGNGSRMYFSRTGNKAAVLRDDLIDHFADSDLMIAAVEEYVTPDNIARLVREGDVVLLAVDNHAARKLVSDFCAEHLCNVCLISGGNDGVGMDTWGRRTRGTYGNCQIYVRRDGENASAPLTRHHPEIADPADVLPTDKSCGDLVASVPQIVFTNLTVAAAMLNAFWLYACGRLHYGECVFDIAEGLMRPLPLAGPHPREQTAPPQPARGSEAGAR